MPSDNGLAHPTAFVLCVIVTAAVFWLFLRARLRG
jgi:hypothetical protein